MPVAHQMTTTQFELDGYQIVRSMGVVREYQVLSAFISPISVISGKVFAFTLVTLKETLRILLTLPPFTR